MTSCSKEVLQKRVGVGRSTEQVEAASHEGFALKGFDMVATPDPAALGGSFLEQCKAFTVLLGIVACTYEGGGECALRLTDECRIGELSRIAEGATTLALGFFEIRLTTSSDEAVDIIEPMRDSLRVAGELRQCRSENTDALVKLFVETEAMGENHKSFIGHHTMARGFLEKARGVRHNAHGMSGIILEHGSELERCDVYRVEIFGLVALTPHRSGALEPNKPDVLTLAIRASCPRVDVIPAWERVGAPRRHGDRALEMQPSSLASARTLGVYQVPAL